MDKKASATAMQLNPNELRFEGNGGLLYANTNLIPKVFLYVNNNYF